MPSEVMDQRHVSSHRLPAASSFFSERQVGFWKPESVHDHSGTEEMSLVSGKRTASPSVKTEEMSLVSGKRTASPSMTSWRTSDQDVGLRSDLFAQPTSIFVEGNKVGLNGNHYENVLFSSSLSEIFDKKLRLSSKDVPFGQSFDRITSNVGEDEHFESLEEIEAHTIGNLLPDDDELLSGVFDDLGYVARPKGGDDMDDDIFCIGGGIELEADGDFNYDRTFDFVGGEASNGYQGGLNNLFANEHPSDQHPSRTLFVRNINSTIEDSELRALFEQYGDVQTLYTACKHRGFVMISYYDIRASRNAMKSLQNKPLRRRKLDIHFSIPKENPAEKDINQGTLVVFNLDSSVSNDDIRQIFGVYGEIKEIRETPYKGHHKFIEFYDVRAAESALRALNRSDIAGKKIKLEPSGPGGARRCLMQQFSPELEQEESNGCMHGSPPTSSPSGCYGSNGLDNGTVQSLNSAVRAPVIPFMETSPNGISSSSPHSLSSPIRVVSVGNHSNSSSHDDLSHSPGQMKFGFQPMPTSHLHSLPEYYGGLPRGISYSSSSTMSAMHMNSRHAEYNKAFGIPRNGSCPLHVHPYSNAHHHQPPSSMIWSNSPTFLNDIPACPPRQMHGLPGALSHMVNTVLPLQHHHVGSAPAMNPSLWDIQQSYAGDATDACSFHPGSLGSMGLSGSSLMHTLELASRNAFPHTGGISSPQQGHMFHGRNPMIPPASFDAPNDRIKSRRGDAGSNQADNRKQYELDIERIVRGEDSRTTLMVKNIPNKYTSKMLLAAIDENNRGTYDFIYLPIDFKNKCNVGYAFINMIDPQQIIPFYQAFNGKKWEKFNSEKVALLAYARIQGKAALIAHFQNSSLMNEDKRCRPILFHSDGPNAGDQEPFPVGANIRSRPSRSRTAGSEENNQGSPSTSPNLTGASLGFARN